MSSPPYLSSLLNDHIPSWTLRPSSTPRLIVPRTRTELAKRAFCVAAPSLWNSLPVDVVDTTYLQKTLKNLSVSLRLPHLIRLPSASESVEYTALYKFFF